MPPKGPTFFKISYTPKQRYIFQLTARTPSNPSLDLRLLIVKGVILLVPINKILIKRLYTSMDIEAEDISPF